METEIYNGDIFYETYKKRIHTYQDLVRLPEIRFHSNELNLVVNDFNKDFANLVAFLAVTYTTDGAFFQSNYLYIMNNKSRINPYSDDEKTKSIVAVKENEFEEAKSMYSELQAKYLKIIDFIRLYYPEFEFG